MGRIIPPEGNFEQFATPDVVVQYVQPPTILGETGVRTVTLIGDFNWGPELESTSVNDFLDLRRKFGNYSDGQKGYLDGAAMFSQGYVNGQIIRIVPPEGSPVAATYTVTNTHWSQTDAGNILRFIVTNPTYDRPTNVTIEDGAIPGTNVTITVTSPLYQIDGNSIVKFIYNGSGIGTGTTITIEDGTTSGKKITINEGQADEEVYDNVDMDELTPSSYLVEVINSGSSLVRVERLSGTNVDTLPANQVSTAMTDTNVTTYSDLDMDETGGSYIVDTINNDVNGLVKVERLSNLTDDTLPTLQSATAMSDSITRDIIKFDALSTGLNGNNIRITIENGTVHTKTISITDLTTNQTEIHSNLDMDSSVPGSYIVDYINSNSTLVTVTRVDTNEINLLPRNINTQSLSGGSDGGMAYASLVCKDIVGNDIFTVKGKYRGSFGNDIAVKIINNNDTSIDVQITDSLQRVENYRKLTMNSTDTKYAIDYINNRSELVTLERNSVLTDDTLPVTIASTHLTGGSNGDPVNDLSIQNGIDIADQNNYDDVVTFGSQDLGTSYANAKKLRDLVISKQERNAVISPPSGSSHNEAISFVDEIISEFVILAHPEQKFVNPDNSEEVVLSAAAFVAGRLGTLSFESSPSQQPILGSLGNVIPVTITGSNAESDDLTRAGVMCLGFKKGLGQIILNGINTSGDETLEQVSTISMRSFLARNMSDGLNYLVSKLHTTTFREKIKSVLESYLETLLELGKIGNPDSEDSRDSYYVQIDSSNNPRSVVQSRTAIVDVKVLLLSAADHILIRLEAGESVEFNYQNR